MYVIEYRTGEREDFDGSRRHLVQFLAHSQRPIGAVYEQVTVITKAVRVELARMPLGSLSPTTRNFVSSPL